MQYRIEHIASRWLGLAALSLALAGMYLPVLMVFVYSFNASRIGTVWTGFSFDAYRQLPFQADLWKALAASCGIGTIASTLSVVAGTSAAMGLSHWPRRLRSAAQGVLAL